MVHQHNNTTGLVPLHFYRTHKQLVIEKENGEGRRGKIVESMEEQGYRACPDITKVKKYRKKDSRKKEQ